jgi:hypothetical protein
MVACALLLTFGGVWPAVLNLAFLALKQFAGAMGTSLLNIVVRALIVPGIVLLVKLYRQGPKAMLSRVRENLKDTAIVSAVIATLVYGYQFYAVWNVAPPDYLSRTLRPPDVPSRIANKVVAKPIPNDARIQFTSSPLWTEQRRLTVRSEIAAFDQYLTRIGITPPALVPFISISENKGVGWAFTCPENPPLDGRQIPVSTKNMTARWIRQYYADYVFDMIFDSNGCVYDPRMPEIVAEYLSASSLGKAPDINKERFNGWLTALWEIRTNLGEDFADRVVAQASKAPIPHAGSVGLDQELGERLDRAIWAVKNSDSQIVESYRILKLHGLLR